MGFIGKTIKYKMAKEIGKKVMSAFKSKKSGSSSQGSTDPNSTEGENKHY